MKFHLMALSLYVWLSILDGKKKNNHNTKSMKVTLSAQSNSYYDKVIHYVIAK